MVQGFNPRTRVGCDLLINNLDCIAQTDVSIHAPAWGATALRGMIALASEVSIHAPAWGATKLE